MTREFDCSRILFRRSKTKDEDEDEGGWTDGRTNERMDEYTMTVGLDDARRATRDIPRADSLSASLWFVPVRNVFRGYGKGTCCSKVMKLPASVSIPMFLGLTCTVLYQPCLVLADTDPS